MYSRITIALRPARRRAQVIPAYRNLQINLQHRFYIKGLNTNNRVQTHSGSLKLSSKYNTIDTTTIKGPTWMWRQPAQSLRGRRGPLDGPTWRKRLSNPGCTDLLEVSGDTTFLKGFNNNPEYRLTRLWVYLAHYLDMQGFLALEFFCWNAARSESLLSIF